LTRSQPVLEPDEVKQLTALLFALSLTAAAAGGLHAQQIDQRPILDMRRLYQFVGRLYNLDPDLLEAIATAESNGNPQAVSPKGAEGLMQLMPQTAREMRVDHPLDPVENVFGAARFLTELRAWSRMQASYGEVDLPAMIAAYNAGPKAVEKYGGIPPYAETQAYVRKVLWLYLLGQPPPRKWRPPASEPRHSSASARIPKQPQFQKASAKKVKPASVFDQLAEIKRRRAQEQSRELAERSHDSGRIVDRDPDTRE
jgi:hypothetical protein